MVIKKKHDIQVSVKDLPGFVEKANELNLIK